MTMVVKVTCQEYRAAFPGAVQDFVHQPLGLCVQSNQLSEQMWVSVRLNATACIAVASFSSQSATP